MLTIEQAIIQQPVYRAQEQYRQKLNDTVIVAAVGATAVGKNFLMQESGLPIVGTLTTREPRSSDDPKLYRYTDLDTMLEKIEDGEVVQYGVHKPNIYASELRDYSLDTPNISDIYYNAVEDLRNKGFKSIKAISTLTSKEQWMSQLWERFEGMSVGAIHARLVEAKQSLRWTRAQHLGARAANHLVIINDTNNVDENVSKILDFANSKYVPSPDDEIVIKYITGMEGAIDTMYGRLRVK